MYLYIIGKLPKQSMKEHIEQAVKRKSLMFADKMCTEYFSSIHCCSNLRTLLALMLHWCDCATVRLCIAKLEIEMKEGIKNDSYTRKIKRTSHPNVVCVCVCVYTFRMAKRLSIRLAHSHTTNGNSTVHFGTSTSTRQKPCMATNTTGNNMVIHRICTVL